MKQAPKLTYLSLAILLIVIAIVLVLASRPHHELAAQSPPPLWMQHPVQEDAALRNRFASGRGINYLNSIAPTFDRANFGPGTRTIYWRAPWVIAEIFTAFNGVQYAITSSSVHGGEGTFYEVGMLANGHFFKIAVPGTGVNTSIEFMSSGPNTPIIQVLPLGQPNSYFAVGTGGAFPVAGVTRKYRGDPPAEECQDVRATPSRYAFLLHRLPLVTKAELSAASLGVANSQEAYVKCYHFATNNIVKVGSSIGVAVTYRVVNGRMVLLTRGGPDFASRRYLLFRITEPGLTTFHGPGGAEYQDYMQDYLEVFAL